ncbi:MAG TPA: PorP/SprF family type IX secretion system membrane protein [Chitinophagales bacterium]|nr:PorP/SprF family type IX secretion system membrane protein [Chitinophagales bacterium]HRK28094.1 PorP/SprF family type IX secretion system membrane protein [Chitinophagales bacterium]
MKTTRFLYFLLLCCCVALQTPIHAQDVHFSQNYATPLLINPAMTGLINGDLRVSAIYRNQWASVMPRTSFQTISASADMAFPGFMENDRLSAGLVVYNDRAGDLNWTTNYADAAFAYNLALAPQSFLSLGVQGGINQRYFDLTNAQFGDQADGNGFNPAIPTNDFLEAQNRLRLHIGGGALFFHALSARKNVFVGAAMYHLNKPNIAVTDAEDRFKNKLSAQAGGSIPIAKKWDLLPSIYFIWQGAQFKTDVGSFARYIFATNRYTGYDKALNMGVWLRAAANVNNPVGLNTLVLATKIDYEQFSLGISYDITLFTPLMNANNGRGGPEITLIYTGRVRPVKPGAIQCPRF